MMIYFSDGTHFAISNDEENRLKSFVYDSWGERDYEATVRNDWDFLDDLERNKIQTPEFAEALRKLGLQIPPEVEDTYLWLLEQMQRGVLSREYLEKYLEDLSPAIAQALRLAFNFGPNSKHSKTIKNILKGFPDETIEKISKIFDSSTLNVMWVENTYMHQKYTLALQTQKEVESTKSLLTKHLSKCNASEFYPHIIADTMNDALKLATAYSDLLHSELKQSRYRPNGTEYQQLTIRAEWNKIIVDVVTEVEPSLAKLWQYEECRCFSLTSKLLAAIYPWCWGKEKISHNDATKMIRERYKAEIKRRRKPIIQE